MAIKLTTLPPDVSLPGITSLDEQRADGLAKEVVVRLAAKGIIRGVHSAMKLLAQFDMLASVIDAACAANTSVVDAVMVQLVQSGQLKGVETDRVAAVAGVVASVVHGETIAIDESSLPTNPRFGQINVDGVDLLSTDFEAFRVVWTRTLAQVRPDLYEQYRALKDAPVAASRPQAYRFAFSVLQQVIAKQSFD